jgi:hypothetical protein
MERAGNVSSRSSGPCNRQESLLFCLARSALREIPCIPARRHSTMGRHGKRDRISSSDRIRTTRRPGDRRRHGGIAPYEAPYEIEPRVRIRSAGVARALARPGARERRRPGCDRCPPEARSGRTSLRGEQGAQPLSPSRRDAPLVRSARRHDRGGADAGWRLVHGDPRALLERSRQVLRGRLRSEVEDGLLPQEREALRRQAGGESGALRQGGRHRPAAARRAEHRAGGLRGHGPDVSQPPQLDGERSGRGGAARGLSPRIRKRRPAT